MDCSPRILELPEGLRGRLTGRPLLLFWYINFHDFSHKD
jgi:hypothetical protein